MTYYICYTNVDRIKALKLCSELKLLGVKVCMIDRGDRDLLIDPMEDIMNGIKNCNIFIILHSDYTNTSVLSQIEITYAKNQSGKNNDYNENPIKIYLIKTDSSSISDSIRFEIGNATIIYETNMVSAAKKLIKSVEGEQ